jgi:hypothetical protein
MSGKSKVIKFNYFTDTKPIKKTTQVYRIKALPQLAYIHQEPPHYRSRLLSFVSQLSPVSRYSSSFAKQIPVLSVYSNETSERKLSLGPIIQPGHMIEKNEDRTQTKIRKYRTRNNSIIDWTHREPEESNRKVKNTERKNIVEKLEKIEGIKEKNVPKPNKNEKDQKRIAAQKRDLVIGATISTQTE